MWHDAPRRCAVPPGEIHLWRAQVVQFVTERLRTILSADEKERASRFRSTTGQQNYIMAHGLLREILSRYLDLRAQALMFNYNAFGKPSLAMHQNPLGIEFNLSHSNVWVLVAVSRQTPVGIDIEHIKPLPDEQAVARLVFSKRERELLIAAPPVQKLDQFYRFWSRKEAYIKALGLGLSLPLREIDLALDTPPGWTIRDLETESGYVAAVAVNNPRVTWQYFSPHDLPR